MMIETPKHKELNVLQIYVTKSGKIRVYDGSGEWTKAKEANP
jgi:ribosomal protein S18